MRANKIRILITLFLTFSVVALEAQKSYFYSAQTKGSYTLYSKLGKRIFNSEYDWISSNYLGWLFCKKDNLIKVYDSTGRYLSIDSIQETQTIWPNTNLIPLKRNGYWGYYSREGKLRLEHKYDDATLFKNEKAAVKIQGQTYFIDTIGNIIPEKYTLSSGYLFEKLSFAIGLTNFLNGPQETFSKDKKIGLIEKATGKVLIDALYDGMYNITNDNVVVKADGKYGVVNFSGKVIVPIKYDMIYLLK